MSGQVKRTRRGRRLRRRLLWSLVILGVLLLALGAAVVQAVDAAGDAVRRLGSRVVPPPVRRSARTGSP
jgi:hypothetical protein